MKVYHVTVQTNTTVRFSRMVSARDEAEAKGELLKLFSAIDSGMAAQSGEFNNDPFGDASFEVTEAPKIEHDFTLDDIEVELEGFTANDVEDFG